jgi:hypothetical protein
MNVDRWNSNLCESNFSGVDLYLPTPEDPDEPFSFMVSTAVEDHLAAATPARIVIVIEKNSSFQQGLASQLSAGIANMASCEVIDLLDVRQSENDSSHSAVYLLVPDLERQMMPEIEPQEFEALHHIILSANYMIWLAKTDDEKLVNPAEGMIAGIMRNVQAEFDDKKFVSVIFQDSESASSMVNSTLAILHSLLLDEQGQFEPEYRQINPTFVSVN